MTSTTGTLKQFCRNVMLRTIHLYIQLKKVESTSVVFAVDKSFVMDIVRNDRDCHGPA